MFKFLKSLLGDDRPDVPTRNGVPYDSNSAPIVNRDSRPYQKAVVSTAIWDAGLKDYEILSLMDGAAHVSPDVIAEHYGKDVAAACARLQAYNAKR